MQIRRDASAAARLSGACQAVDMANSPTGDSMTERIVRVLETFTSERAVQSASEIGRRSGLPSSSAHRIVDDLVSAGLLDRDEDAQVRLGMRLWELALRGSSDSSTAMWKESR